MILFYEENISLSDTMKIGAFADTKKSMVEPELIIPNIQFSKLFSEKLSPPSVVVENEVKSTLKEDASDHQNGNSQSDKRTPTITMMSTNDDFIMKTPFASVNANSELSMFYQEWQAAPPLKTFNEVPTLAEQDLAKQLETFESDMQTYDDVLKSLCSQSPNNN
ncbi:Autophagy-related protein 13 [Popillia japonica]|uniref:Autophagy-related protein 13 n=1 Tax=Popillia japonica TaxID=7064 RepID=A0AAW1N9X5_POPJA